MSDKGKIRGGQPIIIDDDPGGIEGKKNLSASPNLTICSAVAITGLDGGSSGTATGYTSVSFSVDENGTATTTAKKLKSCTIIAPAVNGNSPAGFLELTDNGTNIQFTCSDNMHRVAVNGCTFAYQSQTLGRSIIITIVDQDGNAHGPFTRNSALGLHLTN